MIGIIRRDEDGKVVGRDVYNIIPLGVVVGADDEQFDLDNADDLEAFNAPEHQVPHQYKSDRAGKYSPTGDQLDLLIKALKHMKADGVDIGTDGDALIAMSDAVKAEYPKPA